MTSSDLAGQLLELAETAADRGQEAAASLVRELAKTVDGPRFLCHADEDGGEAPSEDCVLDYGARENCSMAMGLTRKEDCPYWRPGIAFAVRDAVRERLLVALHDAIRRPLGVVPASADAFYDPERCRDAECAKDKSSAGFAF